MKENEQRFSPKLIKIASKNTLHVRLGEDRVF